MLRLVLKWIFFVKKNSAQFSIISVLRLFLLHLRIMFGGLVTPNLMTKKEHNINCINKILGLNIPQITEAVRNAIRKHNIFDGDRPNNTDLLYIAFECLTSYLDKLNLQHIRANVCDNVTAFHWKSYTNSVCSLAKFQEQNLLEEINRIGQILEIVNVGRYLQYVDYRFRISSVLSRKVSDNMVSLTLSGVYFEAEKAFKNQDKQKYAKVSKHCSLKIQIRVWLILTFNVRTTQMTCRWVTDSLSNQWTQNRFERQEALSRCNNFCSFWLQFTGARSDNKHHTNYKWNAGKWACIRSITILVWQRHSTDIR